MTESSLDIDYRCGYCSKFINSTGDPRVLPCKHICCMSCLKEDHEHWKGILCPECTTFHEIENVADIPKLLPRSPEATTTRFKCDKEGCTNEPVTNFCVDCKHKLCEDHLQIHQAFFDEGHDVVTTNMEVDSPNKYTNEFCEHHRNQKITRACEKCQELLCNDCDQSDHCMGQSVDIDEPKIDVGLPKAKVEIRSPSAGIDMHSPNEKTEGELGIKMPDVHLPNFGIIKIDTDVSLPDVDVEVTQVAFRDRKFDTDIDVNEPSMGADGAKASWDVKYSDTDVDTITPKPKVKGEIGFRLPKVKFPSLKVDGSDVDVKVQGQKRQRGIRFKHFDFHLPKFGGKSNSKDPEFKEELNAGIDQEEVKAGGGVGMNVAPDADIKVNSKKKGGGFDLKLPDFPAHKFSGSGKVKVVGGTEVRPTSADTSGDLLSSTAKPKGGFGFKMPRFKLPKL